MFVRRSLRIRNKEKRKRRDGDDDVDCQIENDDKDEDKKNDNDVEQKFDEETLRWRNERRKNYPRSATTVIGEMTTTTTTPSEKEENETDEQRARKKNNRESELEAILREQRRLGSFEATALLKQDEEEKKNSPLPPPPHNISTTTDSKKSNKKGEVEGEGNEKLNKKNEQPCRFWTSNGKCRKGDRCHFQHDENERASRKNTTTNANINSKRQKLKGEVPLLRRIFKNDIDRDNSRLLQAIRFFVVNIDALRNYAATSPGSERDNVEESLKQNYLKLQLIMFDFVDNPVKYHKNNRRNLE